MVRLAKGVSAGDEDAGTGEARRQLAAFDSRMGSPHEVSLAVTYVKPALAQAGGHAFTLARDRGDAPGDYLRAAAQRLQGAGLRDLRHAKVGLRSSASRSSEPGPPIA